MLHDATNSPLKRQVTKAFSADDLAAATATNPAETNGALQKQNIARVQALLAEFLAGRPEGYMTGVSEAIKGSVLGGLIPGGEAIRNKSEFQRLNEAMGDYMEMRSFVPSCWRAVGDDVYFNVDWAFVWKVGPQAGTLVETRAVVRKVLKAGLIVEKYHMLCPSLVAQLTGAPAPPADDPAVARVRGLLSEYMGGNPAGYMEGVAEGVTASMLGGLIPGADSVKDKASFQRVMDSIGEWIEVSKFEPCHFRGLPNGEGVMFNVEWTFTWKPTGKQVQTTAIVRKVLDAANQSICEKYHMVDCDEVMRQANATTGEEKGQAEA